MNHITPQSGIPTNLKRLPWAPNKHSSNGAAHERCLFPPRCGMVWAACRGGMGGVAHWPDAGGVNDQAAWVVDGFAVLGRIDAALDAEQRQLAGR